MTGPGTLGERIAQSRRLLGVRENRDISPSDLAGRLGVSAATVYRWESNEKSPREDALAALAALFGVTRAYLRYGEGETAPPERFVAEVDRSEVDQFQETAMPAMPAMPKQKAAPREKGGRKAGNGRG